MQVQRRPFPMTASAPLRPRHRLLRYVLMALALELCAGTIAPLAGASYDLRSGLFFALLTLVAVTLDLAVALAWNAWPVRLRMAGRCAGVLLISCAGALVA